MGRKIPGRKHRGVKDPLDQKAERERRLAPKINAPPSNPDEQEVPKSLLNLMHLKQMTKEGKFGKKKRKRNRKNRLINTAKLVGREIKIPGMTKPDKPIPILVQQPDESDVMFMSRVSHATNDVINELKLEEKYKVAVKRDETTGEIVSVEKQRVDPVDAMFKEKLKQMKNKKNAKRKVINGDTTENLSKTARRKLRKEQRKAELLIKSEKDDFIHFKKRKQDKEEGFERFRDEVKFGETVHEPPKLTALPKKAVSKEADVRPGLKNNLLLKDFFKKSGSTFTKNLSGKRKNLSMADKRMLELERNKAIDAYKQLKANRKQGSKS